MSWWGKIIGGYLGFAIGGPIGAILGAIAGHYFDDGLKKISIEGGSSFNKQERIQTAFFTCLFSVMGHLAKSDGRVSEDEIQMARDVMRQMNLDEQQKRIAIDLFNKGKEPDFPLDDILNQFRQECGRRRNLVRMFLEILMFAAYADGIMHQKEHHLLEHISARLGFSHYEFESIEAMVKAQRAFHGSSYHEPVKPRKELLKEAYEMLGVTKTASDSEVKKAYRRLMNQHHPDKLISKGMPEEMVKLATEKTQEIKAAYETIKKARGLK